MKDPCSVHPFRRSGTSAGRFPDADPDETELLFDRLVKRQFATGPHRQIFLVPQRGPLFRGAHSANLLVSFGITAKFFQHLTMLIDCLFVPNFEQRRAGTRPCCQINHLTGTLQIADVFRMRQRPRQQIQKSSGKRQRLLLLPRLRVRGPTLEQSDQRKKLPACHENRIVTVGLPTTLWQPVLSDFPTPHQLKSGDLPSVHG